VGESKVKEWADGQRGKLILGVFSVEGGVLGRKKGRINEYIGF